MIFSRFFHSLKNSFSRRRLVIGFLLGILFIFFSNSVLKYTSTDHFCAVCHVHPHAAASWKQSSHYQNKSGVVVHCEECHLPPEGLHHFFQKVHFGIRDGLGMLFKDVDKLNWAEKRTPEKAKSFTFDAACTHCHAELFSLNLTPKGTDAHVYYFHQKGKVRCINCHLHVGHFREEDQPQKEIAATDAAERKAFPILTPSSPDSFEDYTATIPGTDVCFNLIAIPGGAFKMGSPKTENYREADESPVHSVKISPFWMGQTEVSWDEWEAFYSQTATKDRTQHRQTDANIDAITGPTPPYGAPGQGWGKGLRPAITMTHYAARMYCNWLSQKTGEKFRLPTEAEWEYACRGTTGGAYYFKGEPKQFTQLSFINRFFGADTTVIQRHAWYKLNSAAKTHLPFEKQPNPFRLYNMLGNVKEFCLDKYAPDAYAFDVQDSLVVDPIGPLTGTAYVIRGGSFNSDAVKLRSAARDFTQPDKWFLSDPQSPKSIWWYSDCNDVGFRVVKEKVQDLSVDKW